MTQRLPTSDQLAAMLRLAFKAADELGREHYLAWCDARTVRLNRDLARAEVVAAAYTNGNIDGKNIEQRQAQLENIILHNQRLAAYEESLGQAEARVKGAEQLLEAARVYRSALHDLVDLRVGELGVQAATGRRAMEQTRSWRELTS